MGLKDQRSAFTGGFWYVMSFIEYDDAVFNDFLVAVKQKSIKEIVVRHNEERSEVFGLHWVKVRAKLLLLADVPHYLDIQEPVRQFSLSYRNYFLSFFVKKTCSLDYLWILLVFALLFYLLHQFYPFATCLDLFLPSEHVKAFLEAQLLP